MDALDDAANFFAGWGDMLTLNATALARNQLGADGIVNKQAGLYHGGQALGFLHGIFISAAGSLNAESKCVFYSGHGAVDAARIGKGAGKLLEDTVGGKVLNAIDAALRARLGKGFPGGFWKLPSAIFAANAKGTAIVFLRNPAAISVWTTVEQPILILRKIGILYR